MKNRFLLAAGLVAAGLITAVSAQAATTGVIVTLTGSTAFRAVVFTACTTPGQVFASLASGAPADPVVVSTGPGTQNNGANNIVYEGYIQNTDLSYTKYDLVCSWTGSEAGIAAVCGLTSIANDTPAFNGGTSPLPGVPPKYTDTNTLNSLTTAGAYPSDICLSDTSQAVSLTKNTGGATALVGGERVGVVPFVWMKGKNSSPTTPSWGHIVNMTHPAAKLALSGPQVPRLFTGNSSSVDPDTDTVVVVGRNKGSGTRVNQLLDSAYTLTVPVDQFAIRSAYDLSGVLTNGPIAAFTDVDLLEVGNDGFDSGGSVSANLQCDGAGASIIPIGFLGLSDAIGLTGTGGARAGGAVILTLDGVTESNAAVENAQYTAWGHETCYGKAGQLATSSAGKVRAKIVTGIPLAMTTLGWGVTASAQNAGIPIALMHADKSGDVGYPSPQ